MSRTAQTPARARVGAGFTLVEMAVVLSVLGLIATAAVTTSLAMLQSAALARTNAALNAMAEQVTAFAQQRNRLPCPDLVGVGNEGLDNGVCPASAKVGWFPYLALGLPQPAPAQRALYGVYRDSAADPVATSTPDTATLVRILAAAAMAGPSADQVHLAGDGSSVGGQERCTGTINNPAFVILAPGEDRDGDGLLVDGMYADAGSATGIGLCFPAPTRAVDSADDDRAVAVGLYAMVAKLHP